MNANRTTSEFSDNIVAVMYSPAVLAAGGWLLFFAGWDAGSLGIVLLAFMAGLCGVVMAGPMAVIALYRAIKVDTRPVIWGAALLDAAVLAGHALFLLLATR